MAISIEDAKGFIIDCEKARDNWLVWADRSWREIKKRSDNGKLWARNTNARRSNAKFPVWNSTFKIRQPIVFSRLPIPIGEDTTPDGRDDIGATAAICKERLAKGLMKSFDFKEVMEFCRDDFLITNFGACRGFYKCSEVKEKVRVPIIPQKNEETGDVVFIDAEGNLVQSDNIGQDDEGFFLELEETVDVDDECVYLEHYHYKDIYIDPDIKRWDKRRRIAFANYYSRQAFIEVFGAAALSVVNAIDPRNSAGDSQKQQNTIKVYEYWDDYEGEVKWFTDDSKDFIEPLKVSRYQIEEAEEGDDEVRNGLYNLKGFFPMVKPLLMNQPSDEFWPVPEFYQLVDVLQDLHTIFARMIALTRAIRARLLFDSSVTGLQQALNEAAEGDAFGVTNLAQALSSAGGSLEGMVQYIPVEKLIQSLENLYKAFEQRLNSYYQLTGTSDLLRGMTDGTQRTFGEQQMKEKYALNQIAQFQWKFQDFCCENLNLLCDIAIQMFKPATLAKYIVPRTMKEKDQKRYEAAIGLLKKETSRFRVSLETDSTIAMNEEYDKEVRVQLVNALTTALEKTAQTAQTNPALAIPELHCLKYLVQGFRQGKLFQDEITEAIDQVIQAAQEAKPAFDAAQAEAEKRMALEQQRIEIEQFKAQVDAFVQRSTLTLKENAEQFDQFFDIQTLSIKSQESQADLAERWATEERLGRKEQREEVQVMMGQIPGQPVAQAPQVIVVPQPPAPGPTIINAPAPEPNTTVIQPVKTVPIL